jgi:hypothetical protein
LRVCGAQESKPVREAQVMAARGGSPLAAAACARAVPRRASLLGARRACLAAGRSARVQKCERTSLAGAATAQLPRLR